MRLGIRSKLVILLTAVALVPLVGVLVYFVTVSSRVRLEMVRESLAAVARSEASVLRTSLVGDLKQFEAALRNPAIAKALAERTTRRPWAELQDLDLRWSTLPQDAEEIRRVLDGPGAQDLRRLCAPGSHFAEIFIADRFGQLVVASGRTSDYYQEDEEWWNGAYYGGKGRIFIPPVNLDVSSGVYSVDVCVPILVGDVIVGIGKAVIDIKPWLGNIEHSLGTFQASVMLVSHDGRVLYREGSSPMGYFDEWSGEIRRGDREEGYRLARNGEVQAWAPVAIQEAQVGRDLQMPWWLLVLYADSRDVVHPIYRLATVALVLGLTTIVVIFLAGLYGVDRSIVRRILSVAEAARRIAGGDLSSRVAGRRGEGRLRLVDQIDELSGDFDRMAEQIEMSYRRLAAADALKHKFIQIASHELRTPVSYITGMAKLLEDSNDPGRLAEAVQSMGSKAERLARIIQAMFKLLPEDGLPHEIEYGDVQAGEVLDDLAREVQPFLEKRSQRLSIETASDMAPFRADRSKLFDILENLVTNAIKFTPDGGEVRVVARMDGGEQVVFEVCDQGTGIPVEEMQSLFEPFASGGDPMKHSSGIAGYQKRGMGLGLAIVRYFAKLHGGSVQAATSPDGCTFTVRIPTRPPAR